MSELTTIDAVPLDLRRKICEAFWQDVRRLAEQECYYNEITGGIVKDYDRAARKILQILRRMVPE